MIARGARQGYNIMGPTVSVGAEDSLKVGKRSVPAVHYLCTGSSVVGVS